MNDEGPGKKRKQTSAHVNLKRSKDDERRELRAANTRQRYRAFTRAGQRLVVTVPASALPTDRLNRETPSPIGTPFRIDQFSRADYTGSASRGGFRGLQVNTLFIGMIRFMPILHWLTREADLAASGRAAYRLLAPAETYGTAESDNLLIQGDNLEALKALLPYYAGQVKCVFIDPPYNTGKAFTHYDDNLEHTIWLAMMYPRLELIRELLAKDGSLWISIDDNEAHYLKVVCDEVFGRNNYVCSVTWEKRESRENRRAFSFKHDFLFVYGKNKSAFEDSRNMAPLNDTVLGRYKNPDHDPKGKWQSVAITAQAGHGTAAQFYDIVTPGGRTISAPHGNCWRFTQERLKELIKENRIFFGKTGNNVPRQKIYLSDVLSESDVKKGLTPETIWYAKDVGTNDAAKKHSAALFGKDLFDNPKPEELLNRILHIATNPGDLVLDSFLGSGTTAAVAHKMGRRWIGVEIGDHAVTHCIPRLKKVIEGEQGGISKTVGWNGGGGFRFCRLGPTLFDEDGQIRPDIPFSHLAAHVWFSETHIPWRRPGKSLSPLLGAHDGTGYYLLYNGILGDKRPDGGNVLTARLLENLPPHDGPKVVYGERCLLGAARLKAAGIVFKQTPYEIKGRQP